MLLPGGRRPPWSPGVSRCVVFVTAHCAAPHYLWIMFLICCPSRDPSRQQLPAFLLSRWLPGSPESGDRGGGITCFLRCVQQILNVEQPYAISLPFCLSSQDHLLPPPSLGNMCHLCHPPVLSCSHMLDTFLTSVGGKPTTSGFTSY